MRFHIETFGCKVNQYDSQAIAEQMINRGYEQTDDKTADIIIINSCTVTAESDRKARNAVRRFRADNPAGVIVLTGCSPQANPSFYSSFTQADIVIGNKSDENIVEKIDNYMKTRIRYYDISAHKTDEHYGNSGITRFDSHTRAFLKIQDGCDRFCSYCIIPHSRGRSRSRSLEDIKSEMLRLASGGYKEIVLVGIDLSDYGRGTPFDLSDAVMLTEDIEGIYRVRLGSLDPDRMTGDILAKLVDSKKLCPQFHISLQSGSDRILKLMNRHYTAEDYLQLCNKLRQFFPDAALTTDIMVGYPGETDEDFMCSVDLAKKSGLEKIHIFPYSKREGTKAAAVKEQVTNRVKHERAVFLAEVAEQIRKKAFEAQTGKTYEVLSESSSSSDTEGYTRNYYPVKIQGKHKSGELLNVLITGIEGDFLCGTVTK